MDCKLTADEVEALRAARIEAREKNWDKIFERYNKPGNIDDVVEWDNEGGDDDAMLENEDFDDGIGIEGGKENIGDSDAASLICVEVSSDDEEQKEFFDVFHKCAQERIETVQEVYKERWSEDKISEDGRHHTSKKGSIVKQTASQLKTQLLSTPRRLLAPKSLSYGLKGANKQQAMNGNHNVGLELVKPVYNFDANGFDDGVVSTLDESIVNSPLLQKKGVYYERQFITTTTTTKTIMTQRIMVPPDDETQVLGPIDLDDDDDMVEPSSTKEHKTSQSTFSTPKASTRNRRTTIDAYSAMQRSTPQGTPTKRLSYVPVEIANTTPKPAKGAKHSKQLAIMDKPQEIHVTGKQIQKLVRAKCPAADTDRLIKREMTIGGPDESLIAECLESPPAEKKGDLLSQLKNNAAKTPIIVKEYDAVEKKKKNKK